MSDGLFRAGQGTALLSSLEGATDSELSLMISGERGTARALEFGARTVEPLKRSRARDE